MAFFDFNGQTFFIDNRLKKELDTKIVPDLKRKDKDVVFVVDGKERGGKSVFSMVLGAYIASVLKTKFDLTNVCMQPLEFRKAIENSNKNQSEIYDEAHRGMASARALSEINKILRDLMMEMGQKNLFVIIVLPSFFLLDKYVALFRTTGLFHIYENKRRRGYWVYYNEKKKKLLYMKGKKEFNYDCMKFPRFRGRFFNQYPLNEEAYREKKRKSFKTGMRLTKAESYMNQRNLFCLILREKYKLNSKQIEKLYKSFNKYNYVSIKATGIRDIWAKLRVKPEESVVVGI